MATNTNKRLAVKWIRDKAKKAYEKNETCFVCGTTADLELHHTHSITLLLEKWAFSKGYDVSTDDGILAVREEFIEDHRKELYEDVYTLCNSHHVKLHTVYGKTPQPGSEEKQARWLSIQKEKFQNGSVSDNFPTSTGSFFSAFI